MTSLASSHPTRAGGLVAGRLPGAAHPLTFVLCLRPSAGLHSVPLPQPTSTDVTKTKPHRVRLSPRACPRSSGPRPREKMRGPGESCDARGGGRREAATSQGATGASAVLRAGEERGPGRGEGRGGAQAGEGRGRGLLRQPRRPLDLGLSEWQENRPLV